MDSSVASSPAPDSARVAPADEIDRPVRVALLGHGTVGTSLHRLLVEHREHVRLATQRDLQVCAVLVRDPSRQREGLDPETTVVTDSLDALLATNPDVVCEAMGGIERTRGYLLELLKRGIPVVTANKQLVA